MRLGRGGAWGGGVHNAANAPPTLCTSLPASPWRGCECRYAMYAISDPPATNPANMSGCSDTMFERAWGVCAHSHVQMSAKP